MKVGANERRITQLEDKINRIETEPIGEDAIRNALIAFAESDREDIDTG